MIKKLLRISDVEEMVSFKRAIIYRWIKDGTFPEPIKIGNKAVRWRREVIDQWIKEQL